MYIKISLQINTNKTYYRKPPEASPIKIKFDNNTLCGRYDNIEQYIIFIEHECLVLMS